MKRFQNLLKQTSLLLIVVLALTLLDIPVVHNPLTVSASINPNKVSVHFFDVGKGNCTLVDIDGHYILIDAGYENEERYSQRTINSIKKNAGKILLVKLPLMQ